MSFTSINNQMSFQCMILRQENKNSIWKIHKNLFKLILNFDGGITIRENESATLFFDFPIVNKIEYINHKTIKIYNQNENNDIAIQFQNDIDLDNFIKSMNIYNNKFIIKELDLVIANNTIDNIQIPSINSEEVQDCILALLFNEEFQLFVKDVEDLLDNIKSQIP